MTRRRVLFLEARNGARSQMAEGFLRRLGGDLFDVHSAGREAGGVDPLAIDVMAEVGIDISGHEAKSLDAFLCVAFDLVVTLCDAREEQCPEPPLATTSHVVFPVPDPGATTGTRHERVLVYRTVRDVIHELVEELTKH